MYMYIGQGRARVAIMFSGGIDSTLLAALAHRHVPATEPIELVNVCFDRYEAPDRWVQSNCGVSAGVGSIAVRLRGAPDASDTSGTTVTEVSV